MAFIESTTAARPNALDGLRPPTQSPELNDEDREADEPEVKTVARERPANAKKGLIDWIDNDNIARDMDPMLLNELGNLVVQEFEIDDNSRGDWKQDAEAALDFATQKATPKSYPWQDACLSLDTDILTARGWKPIGDVKIGEMVLSRSVDGIAGYFPVTETFRHRPSEVVHFEGKSIDLLVTANHRMVVEDRDSGEVSFIEAAEFVRRRHMGPNGLGLSRKAIPLTSRWLGSEPVLVYGIPAKAYVRFLGWFISEGSAVYGRNVYRNAAGDEVDYGLSGSSFSLAQSQKANPDKYETLRADIEACGFTCKAYPWGFIVHARSMPDLLKAELRSLGKARGKYVPQHVMAFNSELLEQLLDTLIAGDGCVTQRVGRKDLRAYYTISQVLADQVQEICQKLGLRGTIAAREAMKGGVINGRTITGIYDGYTISINTKPSVQVLKLKRKLIPYDEDVACVEVFPHHTIYVRRNGKAVWTGNSNVIFPLITRASIEFASITYPAIIPNMNVVKGTVRGDDRGTPALKPDGTPIAGPDGKPQWLTPPGAKQKCAERIGSHMSWQLLDQLEYWEWQTDTMLHQLPIVGGAVRKTYRDPVKDQNESVLVPLLNLVWNKSAKSFADAPRHTEIFTLQPFQIEEYERDDEKFLKIVYGVGGTDEDQAEPGDTSAPQEFLEQHRRYDLDDDGYPEPLVVTVHKRTNKVVRIVARYEESGIEAQKDGEILRIKPIDHYTLFPFFPDPRGGSYPIGFGHLLKPMNEAINTTMNQMFDAGHLQIAGGGFVGTSLSLHTGPVQFALGEYKPVNNKGMSIRDSVYQLQFPGPSPVLFQLLGFLTQAAEAVASTQNILSADAASLANMQPNTMLMLITQGMRTYTAIHKRIYRALKSEFAKLFRLNRIYLTEDERFKVGDTWREVSPQDYRLGGGVEPMADPTMITDMQKLARAMVIKEFASDPLCNPLTIRRRYFEACSIERVDEILVDAIPPPQPSPEQQLAQQELQLKVAAAQSKMGQERALELMQYTQAMLNFAKAKSEMTQPQIEWMEAQLELMRMHIEAVNSTVNAAKVDATMHGHDTHLKAAKARASQVAHEEPTPAPAATQLPAGAGPPANNSGGSNATGLPAMAPPPGNQGTAALPGGPGGGLPGPGSQPLGNGTLGGQ